MLALVVRTLVNDRNIAFIRYVVPVLGGASIIDGRLPCAKATRETYLHAVASLARYHRKSPDQLSARDVQRFMVHLVEDRGLAWGTCNCYVHGLRFFYGVTLGRSAEGFHIPRAKEPRRLPEILGRGEVAALIGAAANPRDRALLATTYGAGLRASEVVHLEVGDIDGTRMSLRVRVGRLRGRPRPTG